MGEQDGVRFRPVDRDARSGRGWGRPPTRVPEELVGWLDQTYRSGTYCEIPLGDSDEVAVSRVVGMCRVVCRRRDLALEHEIDREAGVLRIRMRDKRSYTRAAKRGDGS